MKKLSTVHTFLFASVATLSLASSPLLCAQMATPDPDQASKTADSTADKNAATTGTATTPGADKTNSKDTTTSLDKNPSTANTASADKSATKDPAGTTDTGSTTSKKSEMSDKEFVENAAQGGMAEVELGKLAQEKGASADVKQFGSHMVMDHSKNNADLKAIADKKGIMVPATLDAKHQAMVDHLSKLSGPAFDKAYVAGMVKGHEKMATLMREESTGGQDPDLKAFAANTLPTVENHLSDIKAIQSKM